METPDNTPDPQADNQEVVAERPSWLPSNFDKPEDLAKSYEHATRKITEQGQTLAQVQAQLAEIQASQVEQQSQQYGTDLESQLYEAFESGDGRTAAAAAAFLAQQAVEKALKEYQPPTPQNNTQITAALANQELAAKYSDWSEISPKIGELVQQDPGILPVNAATPLNDVVRALDRAYKLAKYEAGQSASTEAAQSLEELARLTKNQAQTMSGTNSSSEATSYWDEVKKAQGGIPRISL